MNLRPKHSTLHARAEILIPWLANGTLPEGSEAAVREHIATCPRCREDYEEQIQVRACMRTEGPLVFAAEPSYQKLLARISAADEIGEADETVYHGKRTAIPTEIPHWPAQRAVSRAPYAVRWLAAAAMIEALALGLGAWAWYGHGTAPEASYRTLASPAPSYDSRERVRVVFRADLPLSGLQKVLQSVGAHIIDGPTQESIYTLGFAQPPGSAAALARRIDMLRADPAVLFAEPVTDGVR